MFESVEGEVFVKSLSVTVRTAIKDIKMNSSKEGKYR